jgi:hypothetical protein
MQCKSQLNLVSGAPAWPAEMPTAPAALPGNQPGPSQPVDPTTLAALATIEDTPTTKVDRGLVKLHSTC